MSHMKKKLQIVLIGVTTLVALLVLAVFAYLQRAEFGAAPEVEQLQRSPHYRNGEFHNLIPTSVLAEGQSALSITFSDMTNPVVGNTWLFQMMRKSSALT